MEQNSAWRLRSGTRSWTYRGGRGRRACESPRPDSGPGLQATCSPVAAEKNTQLRRCAWSAVWGLQAAVWVHGVQGLTRDPTACSTLRGVPWGAGPHPPAGLRVSVGGLQRWPEAGLEAVARQPTQARARALRRWQSAAVPVGLRGGTSGVWAMGPGVR